MIYLDYAANCPVDKDILDKFYSDSLKYYMNPNSNHKLGLECKKLIDDSTSKIKKLLDIKDSEIIYTSGASESNNLVIKGVCESYDIKHIIISPFEHSSVVAPSQYLQKKGIKVDILKLDNNGNIDLDNLKELINDEPTLISVISVESETGIILNIDEISKIVKKYDNVIFHTDATQAIGKINIDFNNFDLVSFTPHKFFGLNGIGVLVKKNNIKLLPQIHGGKSTTKYRSGTPNLPLILSVYNSLSDQINNMEKNNIYLKSLRDYLIDKLKKYDFVNINTRENSIYNILNISIKGIKSDIISKELEKKDIYISTKSACSSDEAISKSVYALTKDMEISSQAIRISISKLTTKKELDLFINELYSIYRNFS